MSRIKKLIEKLNLLPHPEGGFYKESYRSAGLIKMNSLSPAYSGPRHYSTGIYFLLIENVFSAFHKINQDEMWHFYEGHPIELHMIDQNGVHECVIIGRDLDNGHHIQYVVPGGVWFASRVANNEEYALLGCTVSPGFDFKDFILPSFEELSSKFPQHHKIIRELTRD